MHLWPAAPTPASCQGMLHNRIIRPEPELGVGVEAVREHWHWIKTLDKVSDVLHLWFTEGSFSWPGLITGVVTNTSFSPMEVPVSVWINSNAMSSMARLRTPGLPPHSVSFKRVRISIRVG